MRMERVKTSCFVNSLVGLMWLSIFYSPWYFQRGSVHCEILFRAKKAVHWKTVLSIITYTNGASDFCIICFACFSLEVPIQNMPVVQKTGSLHLAEQLCVRDVHVCVGFLGRRNNVLPFQHLKPKYIALGDAMKELFLRPIGVSCFLVREYHVLISLRTIRAQCNSR